MNILFAGTPEFAARHLDALLKTPHHVCAVITRPDQPGKRGKQLIASPVKVLAEEAGLPVLQPQRLNPGNIEGFAADLMIVVAYGQILSKEVLATPRLGCINVHASLLPRWRGAAPIQRAILAGDATTGVTVIQMDEGLDTGDMLGRREVPINTTDTTASLTDKLAVAGPPLLAAVIDALAEGNATAKPQAEDGVTYAHKITKDQARLDWQRPARELARVVRAFNPDPVAWGMLDDMRIKIWSARTGEAPADQAPGTITDLSKAGVTVACSEGSLLLTRVQLPLGKGSILSGADILNARKDLLAPGKRFH